MYWISKRKGPKPNDEKTSSLYSNIYIPCISMMFTLIYTLPSPALDGSSLQSSIFTSLIYAFCTKNSTLCWEILTNLDGQ